MNKTNICRHCCCQPDPCTTNGLPHSLSVAPEAGCILAGAGRSQLLSFFSGAPSFYLTILIAHQSDGVPKPYNHIVAFTMSARYLPPAQTQTRSSRDTRLFKSTFSIQFYPHWQHEKKDKAYRPRTYRRRTQTCPDTFTHAHSQTRPCQTCSQPRLNKKRNLTLLCPKCCDSTHP